MSVVRLAALIGMAALVLCGEALIGARQSPEELARNRYQSGLNFLNTQKYEEALRDFRYVVDSYGTSSVADDALLQIARYHLSVSRDLDEAQNAINQLQGKYPTGDAQPFALVLNGQLALARGRQAANVTRALSEFERVPVLYKGSEAVPEAMLARADTMRLTGRCPEAVQVYSEIAVEYPRSVWAPRANIGSSQCLVAQGRAVEAMAGLQLAVRHPMAQASSARARALNTVLYRLYIRPQLQPPFEFSGTQMTGATARMREVKALATAGNALVTVLASGMSLLDVANKGAVLRTTKVENARGVFVDPEGRAVAVASASLVRDQDRAYTLSVPKPDRTLRLVEDMTAAATLSSGDLLAADSNGPVVHRFGRDQTYTSVFAKGRADRMAVGSLDQVAVLDKGLRTIALLTHDGRALGTIAQKGQNWAFDEPVDIAFDAFDHLYVLDRGLATVFVFATSPSPKSLLSSFSLPEKSPGAFRRPTAMALDGEGRLYIHDDRLERVQVYR